MFNRKLFTKHTIAKAFQNSHKFLQTICYIDDIFDTEFEFRRYDVFYVYPYQRASSAAMDIKMPQWCIKDIDKLDRSVSFLSPQLFLHFVRFSNLHVRSIAVAQCAHLMYIYTDMNTRYDFPTYAIHAQIIQNISYFLVGMKVLVSFVIATGQADTTFLRIKLTTKKIGMKWCVESVPFHICGVFCVHFARQSDNASMTSKLVKASEEKICIRFVPLSAFSSFIRYNLRKLKWHFKYECAANIIRFNDRIKPD